MVANTQIKPTILSDGTYFVDGGSLFGSIPKNFWNEQIKADRSNRIRLSINCLFIKTETSNILIDTGMGATDVSSNSIIDTPNANKLLKNLKRIGVSPRDIDIVLLSNLQKDTVGGATRMDRSGRTIPVFPRAKYIVQKSCYNEIEQGNPLRISQLYDREEVINLQKSGQLELIDGDVEILKGINAIKTGGYSPGNQVFFINSGTEKYIFLGSLIPTPLHLVDNAIPSYAYSLNDAWTAKKEIIKHGLDQGALLIFGRAREKQSGYITEKYGKLSVDFREL